MRCSQYELDQVLGGLRQRWRPSDYDTISRNCNHFTAAAAEALGVAAPPAWVNKLAVGADSVVGGARAALGKLVAKASTAVAEPGNALTTAWRGLTSGGGGGGAAGSPGQQQRDGRGGRGAGA